MSTMTFAILGDGAWGTAIALLLAERPDHRVRLWSAREENARILRERRENVKFLPGVPIPETVELTSDIERATTDADLWISAIPTVYLRTTLSPWAERLRRPTPILSLSKGVENATFRRPTEILREMLGEREVAVLSGPSHAEEVSQGLPASLVAASENAELALFVQRHFSRDRFRVYTHDDVLGVELAGALKNVLGIAAGIGDGLGFGDNAKSALLTRGLAEMTRFGVALGADHATFFGLAGMGDLITTCVSRHGRNRHVGERLGRGERLADILASMPMVAEGVWTARSVHERSQRMGVEMPITTEVYRVLYEDKPAREAARALMLRELKPESRGGR
jgi:glycerol-3-phosphate dehydrogenase (NAD(P)+)